MKLSDYAREIGVTYKTAYRMFKRGELDAYQLPTGTISRQAREPLSSMKALTLRQAQPR